MVAKVRKPRRPTATPAPASAGSPLQAVESAAVETIFSEILGKLIPNYAAQRNVPADVIAAAGLRNGMSPDQVNVAVHKVVTRE